MSPIGTTALVIAKPGSGDAVETMMTTLGEATHQEAGCLMWSLQRGLEDPDVFVTIEKWESMEALQQHLASEHIGAAMAQAGELLAEPPRIVATQAVPVGDPAKNSY